MTSIPTQPQERSRPPMSTPVSLLFSVLFSLLTVVTLKGLFAHRPAVWLPALSCLVIVSALRSRGRHARAHVDDAQKPVNWPVSGPIATLGTSGLVLVFRLTSILALLNPFRLIEVVRQESGNAGAKRTVPAATTPTPGEGANVTRYGLPFAEEWCVIRGGVTRETSHSWDFIAQRYAYDFVIVDEGWRRHTGTGTRPEDYYCYGREILAAADGVVVQTESRVHSAPLLGYGITDMFARTMRGNHVLIRHATSEYGLYAHLASGSVLVKAGERVTRGQPIGRCGHTGLSTEPHLHFHIQDREDFFTAIGLPVTFTDLVVDGRESAAAHIHTSQRVMARRH